MLDLAPKTQIKMYIHSSPKLCTLQKCKFYFLNVILKRFRGTFWVQKIQIFFYYTDLA